MVEVHPAVQQNKEEKECCYVCLEQLVCTASDKTEQWISIINLKWSVILATSSSKKNTTTLSCAINVKKNKR